MTTSTSGSKDLGKSDKSGKFNERPWVVLLGILVVPVTVAIVGWWLNSSQADLAHKRQQEDTERANKRQDADSVDKAKETREQVLTDYGKSIAELVTKHNLAQGDDIGVQDVAKGETLIALRRLNVSDQTGDDKSKVNAGKLKGLLIRYLFDAKLIGYSFSEDPPVETIIDLSTADITKVVLEHAWLPGIGLQKARIDGGNLKNTNLSRAILYQANLRNADFTRANLTNADLTGTDLRFADLRSADLSSAKLGGACYIKGKEAKYLPPSFNPEEAGMVPIAENESHPEEANFKSCPHSLEQ